MSDNNSNAAPGLNENGIKGKSEAMSEGELSSDGENGSVKAVSSRPGPGGTMKVEKCSADFFESSSGNRSEGEVSDSEMESGANLCSDEKRSESKFNEQDNPWTQAAMGIYPSLPSKEGEEWGEENVKAWSEYYARAMEHISPGRRKRYRRLRVKKITGLHPRKRMKSTQRRESESSLKDTPDMEIKEIPENTPEIHPASSMRQESDESSDFDFEVKEEPVSLSDVLARKEQMDLAVLAGENAENLKRNAKEVMFGRGKKRKKNKKNRGGKANSNNIRRESKREYWSNDTFRSTVMQPQFCTEVSVCMYWKMYGYCNKGDACNYSHLPQFKGVAPPTKRIPDVCKFYLQDTCQKGSNCNYYHEEYPCKYFHKGLTCYQGDNCRFSHAPLNEETVKLLEKAWTLVKGRPLTAAGQREDEQNLDAPFPHLYSAPQEEHKIPPAHFALSSPPAIGYPSQSESDLPRPPTLPPPLRYPFSPQGVRPRFDPTKPDPRPRAPLMPRNFVYRTPRPHFITNFSYTPTQQYFRGPPPNRIVPTPPPPPRPPLDTLQREPTPPAYQSINYESDEPGQPPISPLSFLSDDIEEKALTIDAGPIGSTPNESPSPILSPNSLETPFFSDHSSHSVSSNQARPTLSRSDSTQSDPRLSKGARARRGSLSDGQTLLNRSHSAEGLRSPEFLHSDPRVELHIDPSPPPSPDPVPNLPDSVDAPVPVKLKPALQFEMPLPLRDPGVLTKPMDPRVLFQNAKEKAKHVGLAVKREVVDTVETI